MEIDFSLGKLFIEAEDRLTESEYAEYKAKYKALRDMVNYDSEADMLALTRFVIETKERFGKT